MIDSMFQEGTDQALDDQVQRPGRLEPPKRGFWKDAGQVAAAPFQGIASGATKSAALGAEIAGAFGSVLGATDGFSGGMFSTGTPEERRQQDAAREKLRRDGPAYSNAPADVLRQRAAEVMPDPNSTNAAAQLIAGVAEFGAQAVGYTALAGGVAGPALLGADAGLAEADKLRRQGVDLGTRAAAGAVAGVVAGASVALPVAGKTAAQTVGLVAAGGPGGYVAQQAAERAILNHGGYRDIASTYDPFDPVALTFATLVPAAFGAAAMRGAATRMRPATEAEILRPAVALTPAEQAHSDAFERSDANLRELRKAIAEEKRPEIRAELQAELARQTENARKYGQAVAAEPDAVPAARVQQTAAQLDSSRLTPDTDLPGRNAHQDALETAHAQLARGEPVNVSDQIRLERSALDAAYGDVLANPRGMPDTPLVRLTPDEIGDVLVDRGPLLPPSGSVDIRPGGYGLVKVIWKHGERSSKAEAERVTRDDILALPQVLRDFEPVSRTGGPVEAGQRDMRFVVDQPDGRRVVYAMARFAEDGESHVVTVHVDRSGSQPASPKKERPPAESGPNTFEASGAAQGGVAFESPAPQTRGPGRIVALARGVAQMQEALAPPRARPTPGEAPAAGRPTPTPAAASAGRQEPPAAGGTSVNEGGSRQEPAAAALDARATEAALQQPDLMVQLEGREPMKASELLETVRREAEEEAQDAGLVEVAANCFLRQG